MSQYVRKSVRSTYQDHIKHGVIAAVLILLSFWFASLIFGLVGKAQFAWNTANETQKQSEVLSSRQSALEKSIAILKTPRGQDAAIRMSFGVARPGERVIVVVPLKTMKDTSEKRPLWKNILSWVGL